MRYKIAPVTRCQFSLNNYLDIDLIFSVDLHDFRFLDEDAAVAISDAAELRRVREYVYGGGTILASFRSFFADENLAIRNDRQPHGLNDIFGMHYSQFTKDHDGTWIELLEADTAEVIETYSNKYWNRYAAVTRNDFETGHAWYIGRMMDKESLKRHVSRVCCDAGIEVSGITYPVIMRDAENNAGDKLHFIFNYSAEPCEVDLPISGTDILTATYFTEGDSCTINDWGVMVLKED